MDPSHTNTMTSLDTLAEPDMAVSHNLWAYRMSNEMATLVNGTELCLLRLRPASYKSGEDTRTSVSNQNWPVDETGRVILEAQKDTSGIEDKYLVLVVGFVIDKSELDNYQDTIKETSNSKSIEDMGVKFNPTLCYTASKLNVGLVVRKVGRNDTKRFFVLTSELNGLPIAKPLKADVEDNIAWVRSVLPHAGALDNPKQADARYQAIRLFINRKCEHWDASRSAAAKTTQEHTAPTNNAPSSQAQTSTRPQQQWEHGSYRSDGCITALRYTLEIGHTSDFMAFSDLAQYLIKGSYDNQVSNVRHQAVQLLLNDRSFEFDADACRELETGLKELWPDVVDDDNGIFAAKALYSLAKILRKKGSNGEYVIDYIHYVHPTLAKVYVLTYTFHYYEDGNPVLPGVDAETPRCLKRVRKAWTLAKALPQPLVYNTGNNPDEVSASVKLRATGRFAREMETAIHEAVQQCYGIWNIDADAKLPNVPHAIALLQRGHTTPALTDLGLRIIEQDAMMRVLAYLQPGIAGFTKIREAVDGFFERQDAADSKNAAPSRQSPTATEQESEKPAV